MYTGNYTAIDKAGEKSTLLCSTVEILVQMASVWMISKDVERNQYDVHNPPDAAETSSEELQDTQKNISKIETIDTFWGVWRTTS